MSLDKNDLFALRIDIMQRTEDETYIIRELKRALHRSGITDNNEINNNLIIFYNEFGINWITLETISQVQFNIHNNNNNFISSLLNHVGTNNNLPTINEEGEYNDNDFDDMPPLIDENGNIVDTPPLVGEDGDLDDIPSLEEISSSNIQNLTFNINGGNLVFPPSIHISDNLGTPSLRNNFLNAYSDFMSAVDVVNMQNLEPVRITLDKKGEQLIKTYKSEIDTDNKCTVCLGLIKKEDDVSELPCNKLHVFHTLCVMDWLNNYNNRCPICREECGEGKKNL